MLPAHHTLAKQRKITYAIELADNLAKITTMYRITTRKIPAIVLLGLLVSATSITGCSSQPPLRASANADKQAVVKTARKMLGVRYRYGGDSPHGGFDCSGLVHFSHKAAGVDVPRTTGQLYKAAMRISRSNLTPGDLVFFKIVKHRFVSHVGIYLGNGKFIHAPSSGKRVTISSLDEPYWQKHYTSAGRIF